MPGRFWSPPPPPPQDYIDEPAPITPIEQPQVAGARPEDAPIIRSSTPESIVSPSGTIEPEVEAGSPDPCDIVSQGDEDQEAASAPQRDEEDAAVEISQEPLDGITTPDYPNAESTLMNLSTSDDLRLENTVVDTHKEPVEQDDPQEASPPEQLPDTNSPSEAPGAPEESVAPINLPSLGFPSMPSPDSTTAANDAPSSPAPEPRAQGYILEPPEDQSEFALANPSITPPPVRSPTPNHTATPPRPSTPARSAVPSRPSTPVPGTPRTRPRTPAVRPQTPVFMPSPVPTPQNTQTPLPEVVIDRTHVASRAATPAPAPPRTPSPQPIPEPEIQAHDAAETFIESGDIHAADEAITAYKEILKQARSDPSQPIPIEREAKVVTKLSEVLSSRFEHFGDVDNIEDAVDSQIRIAEIAAQTTDPVLKAELQAESFKGLGKTLTLQFEHTGDPEDAQAAVANLSRALDAVPEDSPARPVILGDIAKAQLAQYVHMDNDADLNKALTSCQQAIESLPVDSPARAPLSSTYGKALLAKFERSNDPADINEAVQHLESSISNTPETSPERPKRLRTYGDALIARFKDQKNEADVQTAIETQEQALSLLQPDSTAVPEVQSSLASAYHVRFKELGRNVEDLDRAIDYFKQAVEETPFSSPEHARVVSQLGKAFVSKYRLVHEFELLGYAVMMHKQALAQTPPRSRHRLERLDNLAYAYSKRYRSYRRHGMHEVQADKTEAIRLFNEALQEISGIQNHPKRAFFASEKNRLTGGAGNGGPSGL
ncbi:TPR-1 domain protein [Ceratobasidium sp. AG-Ba]|nr:TPR-1 domain protein [Ceratobasidium sp. AG-Ba]